MQTQRDDFFASDEERDREFEMLPLRLLGFALCLIAPRLLLIVWFAHHTI